jgi:hypothetical protein
MAEILFLPTCSKCGKVIKNEVDCQPIFLEARRSYIFPITPYYEITPNKCPYCGEFFDQIVIPAKLPFRGYKS